MALTFEELVAIDLVNVQARQASEWARQFMFDEIGPHLSVRSNAGFYDSPLEAVFDMWWLTAQRLGRIGEEVDNTPQHRVVARGNNYRVDFLLEPDYDLKIWLDRRGYSWPNIAVELDGHDYHERTREQVIQRNQRDRDLQADGWTVLHFSGSELVRDPLACVVEAYHQASNIFWQHKRSVMAAERAADNQAGATTTQEQSESKGGEAVPVVHRG